MISAVVPVYRNAETLRELDDRLSAALGAEHEVIYVNDACPAGSGRVLEELARRPHVRVVTLPRNQGQHRAILHGLGLARGELVAVLDADLQDPPEALPLLIKALEQSSAEVAFVARRGQYERARRMWASRIFKQLLHWLSGVPADAGSEVVMRRSVVEEMLEFPVTRPYILALIGATGRSCISVPYRRSSRSVGESAYTEMGRVFIAWNGLCTTLYLKWWKRTHRPSTDTTRRSAPTTAAGSTPPSSPPKRRM